MAYPTVNGPYGLIPINLIGGQVFAGSTRHFSIASAYGVTIGFGDPVKIVAGNVEKDVGTATATPVGIFLGCSYTDPVFGKTFRQSFTAGTVATDIRAYVADDPDILFKVAIASAGAPPVMATVTRSAIGKNLSLVQNAVNVATGNSQVSANTPATANTLPLRVVDVVLETAVTPGNFSEVICKWNATMHSYNNPLGA
jgi:hypothetical protein